MFKNRKKSVAGLLSLACVVSASMFIAALPACGDDAKDHSATPNGGIGTRIIAAQGGTVSAGDAATLQIPPGALAADTEITLHALPASNGSAGDVFEFGPEGLHFTQPATLFIRNDIGLGAGQTLAVAHLDGSSFSAVTGSTFLSGVASAPIEHFSKYSTIVIDGGVEKEPADGPMSSMTVKLGAATYSFETKDAIDSAGPDGPKWRAAGLFANTAESPDWPASNPSLKMKVLFTDFVESTGFAPGTYDISSGLTNLVVFLSSSQPGNQGEGPGYGYYSTSSSVCDAQSPAASTPAAGVSGTVTVAKFLRGAGGGVDVTLDNVVMPTCPGVQDFPPTVTIVSAHLVGTSL